MKKTYIVGMPTFAMTGIERSAGRFMRAPDHDAGTGGAPQAEPTPAAAEAAPQEQTPAQPELSTEQLLAEEFGQVAEPTPAESEPAPAEPAPAEEPKPAPVEDRINSITAEKREAERRAAEAERQAEYWRGKAEGNQPPAPPAAATQGDVEPDPSKYEFGEADTKYIADTARYHARQEFAQQQETASLNAEVASMEANWQKNISKAVDKYPDFNEKVVQGADNNAWPCPPVIAVGIKLSEYGDDVAYHLATNHAEATRIAGLSSHEQAREFGRLEGRFMYEAAQKATPAPTPTPAASAAPAPPKNLSRGAGGRFATEADTSDFAAFEKSADVVLKTR